MYLILSKFKTNLFKGFKKIIIFKHMSIKKIEKTFVLLTFFLVNKFILKTVQKLN